MVLGLKTSRSDEVLQEKVEHGTIVEDAGIEKVVDKDEQSPVSDEKSVSGLEEWQVEGRPGPDPTVEELRTLRKVRDYFPMSAFFVAIVELAERFTWYGLTGPFQNYMQLARNNGRQNGGLGLGMEAATGLSYYLQFFGYLTPIPGALIADMYLGKFNTILISSFIYIIGVMLVFVTSLPQYIDQAGTAGYIVGITILAIGMGGIKANVSTLIADQYTNKHPYVFTLKSGERVIRDPATTMQFIFEAFYMCINVGSLSAIATTELEQRVDFWAAFLLPFAFFAVAIVVLILGRNQYVRVAPQGSPVPNALRICGLALKNGFAKKSERYLVPSTSSINEREIKLEKSRWLDRIDSFVDRTFSFTKPFTQRFNLDIAKQSVRQELGLSFVPWTDTFVEEVGRALAACKVFIFYPIYWVTYGQIVNTLISQAGQMQTHQIPNDLMQNIDPIAIILFIPVFEYVIYPVLRKMNFAMLPVTRIFWGFAFAAASMVWAAINQHLIYATGPCYEYPMDSRCPVELDGQLGAVPNDIHVAIQTPTYFLIAISEILASITGLEYAYTKGPQSMKSVIMSLFLVTNAFGSALGAAISPTATNPKLMWMYTGLAIATAISGAMFWCIYKGLNDKEIGFQLLDKEVEKETDAMRNGKDLESIVASNANKSRPATGNLEPIYSTGSKLSHLDAVVEEQILASRG